MLTGLTRRPIAECRQIYLLTPHRQRTHISKVSVQSFDITVDDFQGDELVLSRSDARHEEQRCVSSIHDL